MKTQLELNIRSRGAMSGVLTMGSLDPAFAAATGVDGEPVVVDLRTVEFVEPAGLCALAALLEYLCAHSKVVDLALAGRDLLHTLRSLRECRRARCLLLRGLRRRPGIPSHSQRVPPSRRRSPHRDSRRGRRRARDA